MTKNAATSHHFRARSICLPLALVLSGALVGCGKTSVGKDTSDPRLALDPGEDGGSSDGGSPDAGSVCDPLCTSTGIASDEGWQKCYSCRCKEKFGGWLPSNADLDPMGDNSQPMALYSLDNDGGVVPWACEDGGTGPCINPPLLTDRRGRCEPGGRLVQIDHDNVHVKAIYRPKPPDMPNPNLVYPEFQDFGVIAYNKESGATCAWDNQDNYVWDGRTMPDGNPMPPLDLTSATPEVLRTFTSYFYPRVDGSSCSGCHDGDPFVFTPYLWSTGWVARQDWTFGPYALVATDGGLVATGKKELISPAAQACTVCHRIANSEDAEGGCALSKDSWGDFLPHTSRPDDRTWRIMDLRSSIGRKITFPYWMPDHNEMRTDVNFPPSLTDWNTAYNSAKQEIIRCCGRPNDTDCWREIPTSRDIPLVESLTEAINRGYLREQDKLTPVSVRNRIVSGERLRILSIGFIHPLVRSAREIGDLRTTGARARLSQWEEAEAARDGITVAEFRRTREVIVYCGCCPAETCEYTLRAIPYMYQLGYRMLRIINFPTGFQEDWVDRGYPTDP